MGLVCNRPFDSRAEKITVKFLEKFFYGKMRTANLKSVNDKEKQKLGIDEILTLDDNRAFMIDNKSANIQWMNSNLTNFAIELSFLAKVKDENGNYILLEDGTEYRQQVYGWFINPESKTDIYLFYWVRLKEENGFPYYPKAKKSNYYKYFLLFIVFYSRCVLYYSLLIYISNKSCITKILNISIFVYNSF